MRRRAWDVWITKTPDQILSLINASFNSVFSFRPWTRHPVCPPSLFGAFYRALRPASSMLLDLFVQLWRGRQRGKATEQPHASFILPEFSSFIRSSAPVCSSRLKLCIELCIKGSFFLLVAAAATCLAPRDSSQFCFTQK